MNSLTGPQGARTPLSVLLVDRHEDTRALYAQYLKLEGCEVEEAEDGREALAKALAHRYDIIVAETRLLGFDGYQLCHLLRRDAATSATPVVIVTGDVLQADVARARSAGADAVLMKPCLPETLFAELRKVLTSNPSRSTAADVSSPDTERPSDGATPNPPRRAMLSRVHRRVDTATPPLPPPSLFCPLCDKPLVYDHSHLGGVSARHPEQWDYFDCPGQCGRFEYRQRTRKLRKVVDELNRAGLGAVFESRRQ
jgi:two-component system cell cycle response regulator DivK